MDVRDAVAVVTGAGSGIGAALARRFVAEGAAAVIVSDRDKALAEAVAADIGAPATPDVTDVADEAAVASLVDRTLDQHGRIDLFCSNAGVCEGGGVEVDTAAWQQIFAVNVLAHVYAARAVLPSMLERGSGCLLNVASAAGLLTTPGDAPYTVTKHGAVALAEWLSVTYGDRGIKVAVVCPLGVATPLLLGPLREGQPAAAVVAASGVVITAEEVAASVIEGLAAQRFLILPHAEVGKYWARKAADPDRWLAGMRRLAGATPAADTGTG